MDKKTESDPSAILVEDLTEEQKSELRKSYANGLETFDGPFMECVQQRVRMASDPAVIVSVIAGAAHENWADREDRFERAISMLGIAGYQCYLARQGMTPEAVTETLAMASGSFKDIREIMLEHVSGKAQVALAAGVDVKEYFLDTLRRTLTTPDVKMHCVTVAMATIELAQERRRADALAFALNALLTNPGVDHTGADKALADHKISRSTEQE